MGWWWRRQRKMAVVLVVMESGARASMAVGVKMLSEVMIYKEVMLSVGRRDPG